MKLTIFAATGGIGRHLLEQAIAGGHDVTAAVRNPKNLSADVRTVKVDLSTPDPAMLEAAVTGADAVLSGLGQRVNSKTDAGIATTGTRAIIEAMVATDVRRILVVSAAPLSTIPSPARPDAPKHDPAEGFLTRHVLTPAIKAVLRKRYHDLALMEDLLLDSGLQWTVVRPPRLTDKPTTGNYRTAYGHNLHRGDTISRADVAHYMLDAINRPETIGQAVGIAY
ncbi:NAD(P)-dependent oxidoreductase [Actinokineospora iranica]|uniref:Putative NADH-flavin reductase n=1 Tax=Actinokineospora iranica TaxID=1271860 RepID=A0A1G6WK15_9PSEU|nr:NAD(P)H-binding protein [Actinokineospora iranica]SDD65567.1 Putative NADH-flavin reductase [Actinokineospora iranica]